MEKARQARLVPIGEVKLNPKNPRIIKDEDYRALVASIKKFPKMLQLRPIVVDENMMALGGNKRLRASQDAGLTHVWILDAADLTQNERKQFIIKDNVSYGQWNWDMLANEWELEDLQEWGLHIPDLDEPIDTSILDEEDGGVNDKMDEMQEGVKKAIQIEFEMEHYEEAKDLVKYWREQGLYIGKYLLDKLKEEKTRLELSN